MPRLESWLIGGGIAVAAVALVARSGEARPRSNARGRLLALELALAERARWGNQAPDTARVDEYLAGCVPNGAFLVQDNTDQHRVNFCAAGAGWTEREDPPGPWRSVAKQIMRDAIAGARKGRWHDRAELASGFRPPPGALAVYSRGDPTGPFGHVDRVVRVVEERNGYEAIGANEGGRRWSVDVSLFASQSLLGFVVDGEEPGPSARLIGMPVLAVEEPPLTEGERVLIRGTLDYRP